MEFPTGLTFRHLEKVNLVILVMMSEHQQRWLWMVLGCGGMSRDGSHILGTIKCLREGIVVHVLFGLWVRRSSCGSDQILCNLASEIDMVFL